MAPAYSVEQIAAVYEDHWGVAASGNGRRLHVMVKADEPNVLTSLALTTHWVALCQDRIDVVLPVSHQNDYPACDHCRTARRAILLNESARIADEAR